MSRNFWSRNELLLAFNLYCKLPFGQFDKQNPQIIGLAQAIGRTPSAVAMKLTNFASLDPYHQERGVTGLPNASKADRELWQEVTADWNRFVEESESLLEQMRQDQILDPSDEAELETPLTIPTGPTQIEQIVSVRRGQRFFRETVLASYQKRCCICDLPIPELLIASHIVPWSDSEEYRLNPTNGLCLCSLHDRGFDRGLLTVGTDYKVRLSIKLEQYLPHDALHNGFIIYDQRAIRLPDRFPPDKKLLIIHNDRYFMN